MRAWLGILITVLATSVSAAPDEAMALFSQIMADEERRAKAITAGLDRTRFCGHCHGVDGNSKRDHIPNLAAQHPLYLFSAFEKFANGERMDFVMNQLAQNLTLEDRVNIAVYYANQQVKHQTQSIPAELKAHGARLYESTCAGCHGAQGQGFETLPRLAGQPQAYVEKALVRFKTQDPARPASIMQAVAANLSDADITAAAAYVAGLKVD